MILENFDVVYVLPPFIVAALVYKAVVKKTGNPLKDSINNMYFIIILSSLLLLALWLMLPQTASLSTFGYPEDISDIKKPEQLLHLLQEYNKAIVRVTDIIRWGMFIVVTWLLGSVFAVLRQVKAKLNEE